MSTKQNPVIPDLIRDLCPNSNPKQKLFLYAAPLGIWTPYLRKTSLGVESFAYLFSELKQLLRSSVPNGGIY